MISWKRNTKTILYDERIFKNLSSFVEARVMIVDQIRSIGTEHNLQKDLLTIWNLGCCYYLLHSVTFLVCWLFYIWSTSHEKFVIYLYHSTDQHWRTSLLSNYISRKFIACLWKNTKTYYKPLSTPVSLTKWEFFHHWR